MNKKVTADHVEKASEVAAYVAIGVAEGGMQALTDLLSRLPAKLGISYIVVVHCEADYPLYLAELLAKQVPFEVKRIQQHEVAQADRIYLAPVDKDLQLIDGRLELSSPRNTLSVKPSLDRFFMSLANDQEHKSVAIILSGKGRDGAHGVSSVRAMGGIAMVQEPVEAAFSSMPAAAIRLGGAEIVLPVTDMAERLRQIVDYRQQTESSEGSVQAEQLQTILQLIAHQTGKDFNNYKEATLIRQIERNMATLQLEDVLKYIALLRQNAEAVIALGNNFLISVTAFFRDEQAFKALDSALKKIIEQKQVGDELRIWVPGCATGEEVYSIAMLLAEHLAGQLEQYRVQIFGSDINQEAILQARNGLYYQSDLVAVPDVMLKKYFSCRDGRYQVSRRLKEIVLFAHHDLVQDPPFVRLDVISCRNLMIYLKPELQDRLLKLFHYALRENGLLLLGRSETVGRQSSLFTIKDRKNKIYYRRNVHSPITAGFSRRRSLATSLSSVSTHKPVSTQQLGQEKLSQLYMPASALISCDGEILELFGDCSRFFTVKSGKANFNLYALVTPDLRGEVRAYAQRVIRTKNSAYGSAMKLMNDGSADYFRLAVHFVARQNILDADLLLVVFEPVRERVCEVVEEEVSDHSKEHTLVLEQELALMRENLQTVIEELESANEELQSLNEEAYAANEELQASNEAMETSNEELQASNEELIMVNDELTARSNDLMAANDDMNNILGSVHLGLLVVDRNLTITRYNQQALSLFDIPEQHKANLASIDTYCEIPDLLTCVHQVMKQRQEQAFEFEEAAKCRWQLRISPYVEEQSKQVEGVVIVMLDVTQQYLQQLQISSQLKRLDMATQAAGLGIWSWDIQHDTLTWDQKMFEIYGSQACATTDKLLYEFWSSKVHPDDLPMVEQELQQEMDGSARYAPVFRIVLPGGEWRYVQAAAYVERDASGKPQLMVGVNQDVTERKRSEDKNRLAATVFNNTHEGIMVTDANLDIVEVNHAFEKITSFSRKDVLGKNPRLLHSGYQGASFYKQMWQEINKCGYWSGEIWNRRKDGEVVAELISVSKVVDAEQQVQNYVGVFTDITQIKTHQQRLEYLAHYDALTSLPNRLYLSEYLQQSMAHARRQGSRLAVAYLDLDGFKRVNDEYGHELGDRLLIELAQRMKAELREGDIMARLGGDEFVVVMVDLEHGSDFEPVLNRLLAVVSECQQIEQVMVKVTVSAGVTFYPQDGVDADQLLRQADQAMYQAKQLGKNRYYLFDLDYSRKMQLKQQMRERIRQGLRENQFELYYQPKVNMRSGEVVGMEALLRWHHPEQGFLVPAAFLSQIEEDPLSVELGEWVIDSALQVMAQWNAQGVVLPVSVNIGARQIQQHEFVERLQQVLQSYPDVLASSLELEVLESSALDDMKLSNNVMQACRAYGVNFALDDFGTGYSSLSYLKHLPAGTIKIDQSFVRDMLSDSDDRHIVKAVIQLGMTFQRKVIAEGVETAKHSEALLKLGCDLAQGFAIARPMPGNQVLAWLERWKVEKRWQQKG